MIGASRRTGHWVSIEDQYDHDRYDIGPFPTGEAAREYCDAYNGAQLAPETLPTAGPLGAPKEHGVWSLATCEGYEVDASLLQMLRGSASIPRDASDIARRYGARPEHEWRSDDRSPPADSPPPAPRATAPQLQVWQVRVAGFLLIARWTEGCELEVSVAEGAIEGAVFLQHQFAEFVNHRSRVDGEDVEAFFKQYLSIEHGAVARRLETAASR